jgi:tripartite-type tricarboxylate transporter receptor subunit TctC
MLSRMHMALVVLISCLAGLSVATAQTYPTRNISVIVPFAPGGATDILARQLGPRLAAKLGQTVVVENVSGGSTNIGTGRVARAAPDGYTLLVHNLQISANATLYPNLDFSPEKDLAVVGLVNKNPLVLVGRKSLPCKDLTEFVDWMKKNVAKVALPALGSTAHLATAVLTNTVGVNADLIPYRGTGPLAQDIVGEQVDLTFATPQQMIPLIREGLIKGCGVTQKGHMAQLPDIPSLADRFGPQMDIVYWQGVFAPARTPAPILDKISAALQEAMADPELLKQWASQGVDAFPKEMATPAGGEKFYRSEIARWREVIVKNKISDR